MNLKGKNFLKLLDFTPEEISKAFEAGFRPVSLGDARLRTETAALTALETLHITDQLKN